MAEASLPEDYLKILESITTKIKASQTRALKAVNRELIEIYRDVGRILHKQQEQAEWGSFVVERLAKDLQKKYKTRSMRLRKGDTVKIMRGDFKKKSGKIERLNIKDEKVYITGIELIKKEGGKVLRPLKPSNLLIQELETSDKRRFKKWLKTTSKD